MKLGGKRQKIWDSRSQSSLEAYTHLTTVHIDLVFLQLVLVLGLAPAAESNGKTAIMLKSTRIVNSVSGIIQHGYQ